MVRLHSVAGSLVHPGRRKSTFSFKPVSIFKLNERAPITCCTSYAQNAESQNYRPSTNHMIKKDQDPVKLSGRRSIEEFGADRHCIYMKWPFDLFESCSRSSIGPEDPCCKVWQHKITWPTSYFNEDLSTTSKLDLTLTSPFCEVRYLSYYSGVQWTLSSSRRSKNHLFWHDLYIYFGCLFPCLGARLTLTGKSGSKCCLTGLVNMPKLGGH